MGLFSKEKSTTTEVEDLGSSSSSSSPNRTLHVYYENWKGRSVRVMDEDKSTLLYDIDLRCRRPQITIRRPSGNDNVSVATVNFHPWTRKINVDVHNNSFRIRSKNWKGCELQWESPAFGGQTLTWQRKTMWVVLDHVLMDQNMNPIARFSPRCSIKKAGTIELMDGNVSQEQLDEIMVTGMAVMQDTVYYTSVNAGAAAA